MARTEDRSTTSCRSRNPHAKQASNRYHLVMPNPRLSLALERIGPGDWEVFEKFASEFLAVEYPALRTMAAPNGDKGRDAELFTLQNVPKVAFQYSVTTNWKTKINGTLDTIKKNFASITTLIYVTNQVIGPAADELREETRRDRKMTLDIRDRSWFVDREETYAQRRVASEELAKRFVDPLLSKRGVIDRISPLTAAENKVAVLHLALDDKDQASDQSLTKSCFDSLVLAALHDTSAEKRLTLSEIQDGVALRMPVGKREQVNALTLSTLNRLSRKGPVKHRKPDGEVAESYHLSFEEAQKINTQTAQFLLDEEALNEELASAVRGLELQKALTETQLLSVAQKLRTVLEEILLERGESFAVAVQNGNPFQLSPVDIANTITVNGSIAELDANAGASSIMHVLERPSPQTQSHLRRLADAYTLFAFLKQTPDVQKVMLNVFSEGDIWLDTSAVLPLIGESLIDDVEDRHFTILMQAAVDAGLRLFVTEGVVEEVERHLNLAVAYGYNTASTWTGRVPFLYSAFVLSGRPENEFLEWQRDICGREQPLQDVSDYLADEFSIDTRNLLEYSDAASVELRGAVQELWNETHERRRQVGENGADQGTRQRLVAHDVENAVGVIEYRRTIGPSPMGYRAWWLTLDSTAMRMKDYLKERLGPQAPPSPVLSPDFLTQLLRLGPLRTAIEQDLRVQLPLLTDMSVNHYAPHALLDLARETRAKSLSQNERVVRREVRDAVNRARQKMGPAAVNGARAVEERISASIQRQALEGLSS